MKQEIHIHVGGLFASREPVVIHTVLGSCVAVCLYDPVEGIGGMNHILLPGRASSKHLDSPGRYGIDAMEQLIESVMALGGRRHQMVAKIFGGAHIIPSISMENGVGRKNTEFVLEFLRMEGIKVVSQDLGGHLSRKICFHTDTGDVFLKRVPSAHYSSVVVGG